MKRIFDIVGAAILLVLLCPILVLTAVAVWLKLGSPILFKQLRPGLGEKPFTMFKYRTMLDARDANGASLPDAQRLTKLGGILRSTSLDELPELWNVLKGDMSLVGPRPLLMRYLPLYSTEQAKRHLVRPGITGWAQINGRNALSWEEKFKFDVWYATHHTLLLDLKILLLTVVFVFNKTGINNDGHATMPEFHGTPRKSDE